jgi:hypothetical protein
VPVSARRLLQLNRQRKIEKTKRVRALGHAMSAPLPKRLFQLIKARVTFFLLIASIVSIMLACTFLSSNIGSLYKKKVTVIIYDYGNFIERAAKSKFEIFSSKFIVKYDIKIQTEICNLLLNLDVPLPVIVLLEDGTIRAVIIGAPSGNLWNQIMGKLTLPSKAFLACSVPEELLPWHCASCPSRLVEELRDLSEEEIKSVYKILNI